MLLCLSTEKSNYQLSGCVPRLAICLPVGNYWFSQCFSLLKPALLLLIRLLQSITIHKLCHSFPKLAVIPAAFSACLQRRKPQLNHTDRTNSISISVHVNSPKNVITYFIVCFFQINMYFQLNCVSDTRVNYHRLSVTTLWQQKCLDFVSYYIAHSSHSNQCVFRFICILLIRILQVFKFIKRAK